MCGSGEAAGRAMTPDCVCERCLRTVPMSIRRAGPGATLDGVAHWTAPGFLEAVTSGKVEAHGITEAHPAELRERAVNGLLCVPTTGPRPGTSARHNGSSVRAAPGASRCMPAGRIHPGASGHGATE